MRHAHLITASLMVLLAGCASGPHSVVVPPEQEGAEPDAPGADDAPGPEGRSADRRLGSEPEKNAPAHLESIFGEGSGQRTIFDGLVGTKGQVRISKKIIVTRTPPLSLVATIVETADPSLSVDLAPVEELLERKPLDPVQCGRHAETLQLGEKLEARLTVDGRGTPSDVDWFGVRHNDLERCLESQLLAVRFPTMGQEVQLRITYVPRSK